MVPNATFQVKGYSSKVKVQSPIAYKLCFFCMGGLFLLCDGYSAATDGFAVSSITYKQGY